MLEKHKQRLLLFIAILISWVVYMALIMGTIYFVMYSSPEIKQLL
jgi:hypothetical protein